MNGANVTGKRVQGQAFTGPNGDRRIRLGDLKKAVKKPDNVYEVTLDQIVMNSVSLEDLELPDDTSVVLKPINMKGFAGLERMVNGDWSMLTNLTQSLSMIQTVKIITVLINQDRPAGKEVSEEEVSRNLTPEIIVYLNDLITNLAFPQFALADQDMQQTSQTTRA